MEPAFRGPGFLWFCPYCQNNFRTSLNIEDNSLDSFSVAEKKQIESFKRKNHSFLCLKCGKSISSDAIVFVDGDQVFAELIQDRQPKFERFEPVYFLLKNKPIIKRIAGLPGEKIEIFRGDLFMNGKMAKKTSERQNQMLFPISAVKPVSLSDRILFVHFDPVAWTQQYQNSSKPNQISNDNLESKNIFLLNHLSNDDSLDDLLDHFAVAITNQSPIPAFGTSPCSPFENVQDFVLDFEYRNSNPEKSTPLKLILHSDNDYFLWKIDFVSEKFQIFQTNSLKVIQKIEQDDFPHQPVFEDSLSFDWVNRLKIGETVSLRFLYCDHDFVFSANDHEEFRGAFPNDSFQKSFNSKTTNQLEPIKPICIPFAILEQKFELSQEKQREKDYLNGDPSNEPILQISSPRLYRDVHYSSIKSDIIPESSSNIDYSSTQDRLNQWTVPPNHYFFLGDNSPCSFDSRLWPSAFVPEESIVGIVKKLNDNIKEKQHY